MKNTILIAGLLFFGKCLFAQQLSLFTQYTELQTYLNPSAIPVDYLQYNMDRVAGVTYRVQWLGLEDTPRTGLLRHERVREDKNLTTFGGMLYSDKVGATTLTGLYGRYAYQIRPAGENNLLIGLGLTGGLLQYRLDGSELEFEPDDQLKGMKQSSFLPDFSMGLNVTYYPESGTKWYAGVSMPQTFGLSANFETTANDQVSI